MPSKTIKDVNAPKKPLSAYLLFSAVERPKLKASGLDNFAEMSKALGAAWKQADAKTKALYEKEHEKDKLRYENELKEYEKSGQTATSSKIKTKATSKKSSSTEKNDQKENDEESEDEEEEEQKPAKPVKNSRKKN